jgi:hypothetical protein
MHVEDMSNTIDFVYLWAIILSQLARFIKEDASSTNTQDNYDFPDPERNHPPWHARIMGIGTSAAQVVAVFVRGEEILDLMDLDGTHW